MENKKPRWEVKYEKYLSEEPIKDKIAKMERSARSKIAAIKRKVTEKATALSTEIEELKNQKVTGNFKTKEEYEEAVNAHNKLISDKEKELEDIKNNPVTEQEIEKLKNNKELDGYRNYENNKDKIKNILEYRNSLMEKLEALPKNTAGEIENKKKEFEGRESRIAQYQVEIEDIKQQLKQNLSEGEKQILLLSLKTKMDSMGILQAEQGKTEREIADLEILGKDADEKTESKRDLYERKISKCNIIAANLLKGKGLEDIELRVEPESKTFTSPDGKLAKKIKSAKTKDNSKTQPAVDNKIEPVSEFAQKHPRLAKIGKIFKGIGSKIASWFKEDDEQYKYDPSESKKIMDYAIEYASEDQLLKEIAEKGKAKAFRDRQAEYKKQAANTYAKTYGGKYEMQDGATEKKNEEQEIEL